MRKETRMFPALDSRLVVLVWLKTLSRRPKPALLPAAAILRWLPAGFGQFGDQSQRDGQFIKLEVRSEESDGFVYSWFAWDLHHLDFGVAQRVLRFDCRGRGIVGRHVIHNPLVEKHLAVGARHKTPDFVAANGFKEVRDARDGEHVLQL